MQRALRWLAPRLATFVGITLATFLLLELAPGDPADLRLGRGSSAVAVAALRSELGLETNRPVATRYLDWLGRSLRFDFGHSFVDGRTVRAKVAEALPTTLAVGFLAALFGWGLGVPLGCALALRRRRKPAEVFLALVYALPTASVALVALRAGAPFGTSGPAIAVAGLCLALPLWVRIARHQTAELDRALASDWARTARAQGASPAHVLFRHALRHALLPTVTLLTSELPALLSGSVLVEQIFGLRGLGSLGLDAVLARDYPVLLGLGSLGALLTFAGTSVGDVLVRRLDPRL